jgi:lipopolysaccharide transport system ATP-binding protein
MTNIQIKLQHIYVNGVDTHARAGTLRQWLLLNKTIKSKGIPILCDVSLEAKPGDKIGIIGRNGSGKSSILKVISGNYPIAKGNRLVHGTIAPLIEMGAGFDPEQTGIKNIKLSFAYRGKLKDYSPELEQKIIEFSELDDKIYLPLKTYSSGMVSRLAFSSAVFQDPDIMLLDEVLAAGDAGFVKKSRNFLRKKLDTASIAIIVSHATDDIQEICNRFILMDQGAIIMEGSAKEVESKYKKDILNIK